MMSIKKNWSFKFLLASDQVRSVEVGRQAIMSMPFLGDGNAFNTPQKYGLYPPDADHEVFSVRPGAEEVFSLNNLDNLSVSELQKLRRSIALKLHPDRVQGIGIADLDFEMSEANQCIDDAIKKKSSI